IVEYYAKDYVPLNKLLLDQENPRIHQKIASGITQVNLARFIYDNFGIGDLKDSILKNGYFPVEPMVVIPANDEEGNFIVVEGNRRLTTVKILCDDNYRNNCISIARRDDYVASEELKKNLSTIPVVKAENRESVKAYLGVRHLGGVVRWEPLAQSKYVYNQILSEKKKSNSSIGEAINKFVEETNNKEREVLNHFYKYCIFIYLQRLIDEDSSLYDSNGVIETKFSLLEVALGKTGRTDVAKYLGINSYKKLDPEDYEDIIPEENEFQAKNIIKWVFSKSPRIKESREINKYLKPILRNPVSTKAFEDGEDKDSALLLSDSYDNIIKNSCSSIHNSLTHIQQNWSKTKTENREELKEIYKANVLEKVDRTNNSIDI
ncbi:ParB N-terminal domain-containing protein, partial [Tenacibaculum maritimum]